MNPDTVTARRALIRAYRAYLEAEEELERALETAAALMPELRQHGLRPIGSPRSRIRQLYETRSHSVEVLEVMRDKHKRAVHRQSAQEGAEASRKPPELLR